MKLKTFKDHFVPRPLQIIIIDRPFNLNDDEMHVLALTYEENSYSLWVVDCLSNEMNELDKRMDPLNETNRDNFNRRDVSVVRSIKSLEIGEAIFNFNGSTTENLQFHRSQALHKLQYFIDQGVELNQWDNVDIEKMRLTRHRNSGSNPMLDISLRGEAIKLSFRPYRKEAEVFYKYCVDFILDKPVEYKYYNPFEEKEEYFFVHGFEIYGFEKYISSIENDEKYKNMPKEHIDRMRDTIGSYFENLKSKNSSLVLMTYEAERGLSFQSTEFLDRKMETNASGSSIGFIFKPKKEIGDHGKKLFIAAFQDVPNSQLDVIEFELHSVSMSCKEVSVII